jgi:hypothetical protein
MQIALARLLKLIDGQALFPPSPPALLPDQPPTPRRLAQRLLPISCFLSSIKFSTIHSLQAIPAMLAAAGAQ